MVTSLLSALKSLGVSFLKFLLKGGRVDARLKKLSRTVVKIADASIKAGAKPIRESDNSITYSTKNIVSIWEIKVEAILILKNNSTNPVFNVKLVNEKDFFFKCQICEDFLSLIGNETIEIKVAFVQYYRSTNRAETDNLPDIPREIENKSLIIEYQNEGGTKMSTRFHVAFGEPNLRYYIG